jgi:Fe-S-cluster-containing hydrogenase component 2
MIVIRKEFCPANHVCPSIKRCPVGAIIQDSPNEPPRIDMSKCTNCGLCAKACPVFQKVPDKNS